MADIEKAITSDHPAKIDSMDVSIPSNSVTNSTYPATGTTPAITKARPENVKRYGQQHSGYKINDRKTRKGGRNEDIKGLKDKKHIVIITSMICTFVGSASGLVVLYSHLNEEDAREVIDKNFRHGAYNHEPTMMDRCRTETTNAVKDCFNQSDYFLESVQQRKCEYLESVGICVLGRREVDLAQNCSDLVSILQLIKPHETVLAMADSFLNVNIRNCSFYNETAIDEIKAGGAAVVRSYQTG